MKRQLLLIGGIGLGAVALLFLASRQQQAAPVVVQPSGDGLGLGQVVGAVAGLAGQVIQSVGPEGFSKAGKNSSMAFKKVAAGVGLIGDPERHKKNKKQLLEAVEQHMIDMEIWCATAHQVLARHDVREWVLSSSGTAGSPTFDVYYEGQKTPFRWEVPARASVFRLAWAAEVVCRTLGVFTQRGRRIGVPWIRHEVPAYSDNNPYAPPGQRLSDRRVQLYNNQAKRDGGATVNPGLEAGVDAAEQRTLEGQA